MSWKQTFTINYQIGSPAVLIVHYVQIGMFAIPMAKKHIKCPTKVSNVTVDQWEIEWSAVVQGKSTF